MGVRGFVPLSGVLALLQDSRLERSATRTWRRTIVCFSSRITPPDQPASCRARCAAAGQRAGAQRHPHLAPQICVVPCRLEAPALLRLLQAQVGVGVTAQSATSACPSAAPASPIRWLLGRSQSSVGLQRFSSAAASHALTSPPPSPTAAPLWAPAGRLPRTRRWTTKSCPTWTGRRSRRVRFDLLQCASKPAWRGSLSCSARVFRLNSESRMPEQQESCASGELVPLCSRQPASAIAF